MEFHIGTAYEECSRGVPMGTAIWGAPMMNPYRYTVLGKLLVDTIDKEVGVVYLCTLWNPSQRYLYICGEHR